MKGGRTPDPNPAAIFVPYLDWDEPRWRASDSFIRMSLAAQGAYRNLCGAALLKQPSCVLPDDDRDLWRLAGAPSIEAWWQVKAEVFRAEAWTYTPGAGWLQEVVLEAYQERLGRLLAASRAGKLGGQASARVRHALKNQSHRTTVQRPCNDRATARQAQALSLSLSQALSGTDGGCGNVGNSTDHQTAPREQPTGPVPPGLDQPEPDDTPATVNGPEPRNGRPPITAETAAAITALAFDLEALTGAAAATWVALASTIPADASQGMRSFDDPLARPGISEAWGQTTLRKLREMLAERRRPVPL